MGEVGTYDLPLEFRDLPSRMSRMEDVKRALELAVDQNTIKLSTVSAATLNDWGNILGGLIGRVKKLEETESSEEYGGIGYLRLAQADLDRITLPKIDNDMQDLEKRLRRVEKMTGPHLLVERQDKEKRLAGVEKAVIDLMNNLEAKKDE